jgi:hypothetical protein
MQTCRGTEPWDRTERPGEPLAVLVGVGDAVMLRCCDAVLLCLLVVSVVSLLHALPGGGGSLHTA